MMSHTV
jgi:hypothetical protein